MPFSATRWQHGPWICFANFILVKKMQSALNLTITEAREKIRTDLKSLEIKACFHECLTKFKTNSILLNKMSHRFLLTTKLFNA
jgi:hypothetical protein